MKMISCKINYKKMIIGKHKIKGNNNKFKF